MSSLARWGAAARRLAAVALLAAAASGGCGVPGRPRPRLVVYLLVDALRADRLGCYGSPRGLTPNIDALATGSVVFEEAQATSTWTRSSVASMFTSRYASSHRALGRRDGLAAEYTTLAEVLAAHGLETVAISTNGNAGREFGFAQGFDTFVYPALSTDGEFPAEAVTELGLQAVAQRRDQLARRPLFLYLHYIEPHEPYLPRPGQAAGPEPPGRFAGSRADLVQLDALPPGARTAADESRLQYLYDGEVRHVDSWIGRLVDGLRGLGVLDQALFVLTADHGEEFWEHGLRGHGLTLYQPALHVPLIVRYPDLAARGARRVKEPLSTVDIAPTVLSALGIEPPKQFQGRDLRPLAEGRRRPSGLAGVYSELALDHRRQQTLRLGRFKLIRNQNPRGRRVAALELYDLEADPHERVNLATRDGSTRARLRALLARWRDATTRAAGAGWDVAPEQLSEGVREELKALGYLQ